MLRDVLWRCTEDTCLRKFPWTGDPLMRGIRCIAAWAPLASRESIVTGPGSFLSAIESKRHAVMSKQAFGERGTQATIELTRAGNHELMTRASPHKTVVVVVSWRVAQWGRTAQFFEGGPFFSCLLEARRVWS